jgi:MarR family transcriptional regulator, lower aerobic nicotinate degradation pathway regulator
VASRSPVRRPAIAQRGELSTVDALAQLSFLIQGTLERRTGQHEVSIIQTRLLGVLRDRKPTMNQLAKLLGLDKSSASGLVDRAQRRGLVDRVPSTADRRAVRVTLTRKGRSLVSRVAAQFEADISAILACLSAADRRTLTTLISRVLVEHAAAHGIDLLGEDRVI